MVSFRFLALHLLLFNLFQILVFLYKTFFCTKQNDPGSLPWVVWKLLMSLGCFLLKLSRTLERAHGGTHAHHVHTHSHGRHEDHAQHRIVFLPDCAPTCQAQCAKIAARHPDFAPVPGHIADELLGDFTMKTFWIFALLCCSLPAFALSGGMEKASVHAMRKVSCTDAQTPGRGGFLSGLANGGNSPDIPNDCVEYELHTDKVSYIIRPHRVILLPLGGDVLIKLAGDGLILRISAEVKDLRCDVLAMTLRSEQDRREREKEWEREREAEGGRQYPPGCYTGTGTEIPCDGAGLIR
jgi:hypothetical protein